MEWRSVFFAGLSRSQRRKIACCDPSHQESAANLSKKQVEFIMQAVYIDPNFEKNLGSNKAG
jgi:hypothetical protein